MDVTEILEEFRLEYQSIIRFVLRHSTTVLMAQYRFHRRLTVAIESFEHLMFNRTEHLMFNRTEKTWHNTIFFKPKLRTYRTFKSTFVTESYLKSFLTIHECSVLAQFRSGILPLHIETRRWNSKPVKERLCLVCKLGIVEDEFHFLCECVCYSNLRHCLFRSISSTYGDFKNLTVREKFVYMLKYENVKLAKYLVKALNDRKALLYEC